MEKSRGNLEQANQETATHSQFHCFPGCQAAFRRLQFGEPAAFLFDAVILDSARAFGGLENPAPRRRALAKQDTIALAGGPVLTMHAADAAWMVPNPCHGVGLRLHRVAHI